MKNSIPLILAVVLGLAAVFAVSRLLSGKDDNVQQKMVAVTVAADNLSSDRELAEGTLSFVEMPANAVPHGALLWDNVAVAYGQRPQRNIDAGDYLMISDIKSRMSLADCAREGEWMIPVTFADAALVTMLRPDDEIGILATFTVERPDDTARTSVPTNMLELVTMAAEAGRKEGKKSTMVLLPCVRVVGIGGSGGDFRNPKGGSSTVFVSLPPQQATALVAAQQQAELYPVLRRRSDSAAMSRAAGGIVNEKTFEGLSRKLQTVEIPSEFTR